MDNLWTISHYKEWKGKQVMLLNMNCRQILEIGNPIRLCLLKTISYINIPSVCGVISAAFQNMRLTTKIFMSAVYSRNDK